MLRKMTKFDSTLQVNLLEWRELSLQRIFDSGKQDILRWRF